MGLPSGNGYEKDAIVAAKAAPTNLAPNYTQDAFLEFGDVDAADLFEYARRFLLNDFDGHPHKGANLFIDHLDMLEACMVRDEKNVKKMFQDEQLRVKIFTLAQCYGCEFSLADWPIENTTTKVAVAPHGITELH